MYGHDTFMLDVNDVGMAIKVQTEYICNNVGMAIKVQTGYICNNVGMAIKVQTGYICNNVGMAIKVQTGYICNNVGMAIKVQRLNIYVTRNVLLSAQMGERASVVLICIITSHYNEVK